MAMEGKQCNSMDQVGNCATQRARQCRTLRVCQPTAAKAACVSGGKVMLEYVMSIMSGRAAAMNAALVLRNEYPSTRMYLRKRTG